MSKPPEVCTDDSGELLVPNKCPNCGLRLNSAYSCQPEIDRARPKPEDVCVCGACGTIMQFTDLMILRELSQDQIDQLPEETRSVLLETSAFVKENNPR